jgi:uncharacterized protein (DUF2062 family)
MGFHEVIPNVEWTHITILGFMSEFRPLLLSFIVGTSFIGFVSALIAYILVFHAVKISRG